MNFLVQPLDPIDEAIQRFRQFNETPEEDREYTEDQLIRLVVHQVKQHG